MRLPEIDVSEAIRLHDAGRSWAEIGLILAAERQRRSPFWGKSVERAVRDRDRSEPKTPHPRSMSHPR